MFLIFQSKPKCNWWIIIVFLVNVRISLWMCICLCICMYVVKTLLELNFFDNDENDKDYIPCLIVCDLIVCYFPTEPRPETKVLLGECVCIYMYV